MKKLIVGVSVATTFGLVIVSAAPRDIQDNGKSEQPVTIRGCVKAGNERGTFLLTSVTEVRGGHDRGQPVPTDAQGRFVLYSLNSTKGLKVLDGQRVEVKGTVNLNNVKEGETKVSEDSSKRLDSTTQVKTDGKTVTVETDTRTQDAPTATSGTEKSTTTETRRVVYLLNVKSVRGIAGSCQ